MSYRRFAILVEQSVDCRYGDQQDSDDTSDANSGRSSLSANHCGRVPSWTVYGAYCRDGKASDRFKLEAYGRFFDIGDGAQVLDHWHDGPDAESGLLLKKSRQVATVWRWWFFGRLSFMGRKRIAACTVPLIQLPVVGQFEIRPSHRMDSIARGEQPCGRGALP